MRTRNFDTKIRIEQFTDSQVVIRLRSYVRNRFGKAPPPVKGQAERDRRFAHIMTAVKTGRTWPRTR